MILKTIAEFRGAEKKTSAKGNNYTIVRLEDLNTGESNSLYYECESVPFNKGDVVEVEVDLKLGKYTNLKLLSIKMVDRK